MQPLFIIERLTRTMERDLGALSLDDELALEMARTGQALLAGCCEHTNVKRKIANVVRNGYPLRTLICCHSYEAAGEMAEACAEKDIATTLLFTDHVESFTPDRPLVIATVPEAISRLRLKTFSGFSPRYLFVIDPDGIMFRGRSEEWGGGNRASNIARYRAGELARNQPSFASIWVNGSPAAYSPDTICQALGVEALLFGDGRTVRTAFDTNETPQTEVLSPPTPPRRELLDEPVTIARRNRSHLLLNLAPKISTGETLLQELAERRGYPVLSLKQFCLGACSLLSFSSYRDRSRAKEIVALIRHEVALINKQIVVLKDARLFYEAVGVRTGLFILATATTASLLVGSGPNGLAQKDVDDLFDDICRIESDTLRPGIHNL